MGVGLDVGSGKPVASMRKSWGLPGRAGSTDPLDLRPDYVIMETEQPPGDVTVLELDERPLPQPGERIWFPNKASDVTERGFWWMSGKVVTAAPTHIEVKLDADPKLQSQSGSPMISQVTGRVIGTLSSSRDDVTILLTPARAIADALATAKQHPELRDVVGRKGSKPRGRP